MITLQHNTLEIRFPHVGEDAGIRIDFQRTLRIPDDGRHYRLPPGLGSFPLRHVENHDLGAGNHRKERGGIIMPMFQTDAVWLNLDSLDHPTVPVALKIGAGKINAVSGEKWSDGLAQDPQNYVVLPGQPWLDGFNVGKGLIRQFVAMPLGQGYTVEEQIDSESDVGGIQMEAIPMKKEIYDNLRAADGFEDMRLDNVRFMATPDMGLGMGGSMRQKIYHDDFGLDSWDQERRQRCFVMLANAQQWMEITGEEPPVSPVSAEDYSRAGLPWFDYFDGDRKAIDGAKALGKIKSVKALANEKRDPAWPEESSSFDYKVKKLKASSVSDGSW